jgi:hypothetical protein
MRAGISKDKTGKIRARDLELYLVPEYLSKKGSIELIRVSIEILRTRVIDRPLSCDIMPCAPCPEGVSPFIGMPGDCCRSAG